MDLAAGSDSAITLPPVSLKQICLSDFDIQVKRWDKNKYELYGAPAPFAKSSLHPARVLSPHLNILPEVSLTLL